MKIFKDNFSVKVQNNIYKISEELKYPPNELIFKEFELSDQSIYLIIDGRVELFYNQGGFLKSEETKQFVPGGIQRTSTLATN